jgi:hypothetical protein
MSVQTLTLAEFLLARIAEDEAAARAAIDPDRPGTHWRWVMDATDTPVADGHLQGAQDDGESVSLRTVEEYPTRNGWSLPHFVVQSGEVHGAGGEHIARWDPARVLAECEAKRRIIAEVAAAIDSLDSQIADLLDAPPFTTDFETSDLLLRLLALPYAGHEDYRAEWRP